MSEKITQKQEQPRYQLPPQLDIRSVESLANELKKITEKGNTLSIDASKVERITTPCVQLILSLSKQLSAAGGALHVAEPTECFSAAFSDLGFSDNLKQWGAA